MKKHLSKTLIVLTGLLALTAAAQDQAKEKPKKENFGCNLVLWAAGPLTGRSTRLTMSVERWTTDEERTAMAAALKEGGSDALLKVMRKDIVGYIWTTQSLRYKLNIATTFQSDKGRVVRLVTERPITFVENAAMTPRSRDYEFGVIEFVLDEKGKGEGTLIPTAKVGIDETGKIVVESLGTGPQKLLNVKKEK